MSKKKNRRDQLIQSMNVVDEKEGIPNSLSTSQKKDKEQWNQIRQSLIAQESTVVSHFPVRKEQVQTVAKSLLLLRLTEFVQTLHTVFSEDYIIFKDDQFGWLRKERRLVPLHTGTEHIIDLGCNVNERRGCPKYIDYDGEGRTFIPKDVEAQFKRQQIPFTDTERSFCWIPIKKIIDFYRKYNETVPPYLEEREEFICLHYERTPQDCSWSMSPMFKVWGDKKAYVYWPRDYSSETIYADKGFSVIISKPIHITEPMDVLDYSLQNFHAPRHPLMGDFELKVYGHLKDAYRAGTITKDHLLASLENEHILVDLLLPIYRDKVNAIRSREDLIHLFKEEPNSHVYAQYVMDLLDCDKNRSNLQPYERDVVQDINKGHWEVFETFLQTMGDGDILFPVPQGETLVARDPLADVNPSATCAIDFGTKSTVVAYHMRESVLLRVGAFDLWATPRQEDYENPTTIQLIDYAQFMKDYKGRIGRPFTKWEDLTVSHQAAQAIFAKDINQDEYYSLFSDLKQWANAPHRRQLLQDKKGTQIELKPYMQLGDDDFDPIEIYAYYLGLAINTMQRGICLKYYLSFPVNYALSVRQRILESFTRGIKKSLPPRVLGDENTMKRFKVKSGASEPAAYALSALRAYGVEPTDEHDTKKYTYGVFDFGGGTTDFDFGMEYNLNDGTFDYEVKQFGNGGDPLLGGENILNILAYEVYKANIETMRKEKMTIVRPNDKCEPFSGSEMLVKEWYEGDQASFLNLKILAHHLRPIWEEPSHQDKSLPEYEVYENQIKAFEKPFNVLLYTSSNNKNNVNIQVKVDELKGVIEKHIAHGVDNFLNQLVATQKNHSDQWTWPLHVLLAGNSCKSPILQRVLVEKLLHFVKGFNVIDETTGKGKWDLTDIVRIYPPLGSTFHEEQLGLALDDGEDQEIIAKMLWKPTL